MAATLAKFFIIMTLVFEVITIATGATLYTVFAAAAAVILSGLLIKAAVDKINVSHRDRAKAKSAAAHV